MIPRPVACDGDDCDYTEHGVWRHRAGCLWLEDTGDGGPGVGWPEEYLIGWQGRVPATNRAGGAS